MTLGFSTQINGKPNYFIEKIWKGIDYYLDEYEKFYRDHVGIFGKNWDINTEDLLFNDMAPKRHTIRRDPHDRWRAGVKIHPVINNRSANRFQFAPELSCVSTQTIEIIYEDKRPNIFIDKWPFYYHTRRNTFGEMGVKALAINDGFESVESFFAYFNTDFNGKIIHWTDLKYM